MKCYVKDLLKIKALKKKLEVYEKIGILKDPKFSIEKDILNDIRDIMKDDHIGTYIKNSHKTLKSTELPKFYKKLELKYHQYSTKIHWILERSILINYG
jgi:hypothetical protein